MVSAPPSDIQIFRRLKFVSGTITCHLQSGGASGFLNTQSLYLTDKAVTMAAATTKGRSRHPLLQELHLNASDVLTYLLEKEQVSEETVRAAHCELLRNRQADAALPPERAAEQHDKKLLHPPFIRRRRIALRFYYDGGKYSGLAENVGSEKDNSVEKALFAALDKAHLVESRSTCAYSRCGRTDRGVSAAGQVVALDLKSAFSLEASWDAAGTSPVDTGELPNNPFDKITVWVPPRRKNKKSAQSDSAAPARQQKELSEYDYAKILNNLLPDEIRVLGYSPVSQDFSARFSATTRTYRYFFLPHHLNLPLMQDGLDRLVGTHDFRNFCKMDIEKVYNFERKIHSARVVVVATDDDNDGASCCYCCYLEIVGQAFLWHQIRCIASVLFLVGRGLEEPSVVTSLLNVQQHPGKPAYPLAPERPLVLHDCGYADLRVGYSVPNLWHVACHQERQWQELVLAAARIRNCTESLREQQVLVEDVVSFARCKLRERRKKRRTDPAADVEIKMPPGDSKLMSWGAALEWMNGWGLYVNPESARESVYIPLLERSVGTTYEEKVAALQKSSKKRQKYEANVIKKRKTKEEDAAFYVHMTKQGGSGVDCD